MRSAYTIPMALAATIASAGILSAQETGSLTGQVIAQSTSRPLAGAQVAVEGLEIGTLANSEGRFILPALPAGTHTVTVSFVGYGAEQAEVVIQPGVATEQNFALSTSAIGLDEIVVTGTGGPSQRRRLGQTVSSIGADVIETAPIQNVTQALQGRIPGMIGGGIGLEGSAARIRIRGAVSLSQRNSPLIYVDGVRMDNTFSKVGANPTSRLDDINPSNIERIEVLKGAAAATLFGTEASSGVIQIFTKRGVVSEPTYTFQTTQQISSIDAENRMPRNYAWDRASQQILSNHPAPEWVKPAWQQTYYMSVRGGTPGMRYFASGNVADRPGSAPNNAVQNYGLRSGLDFHHTDKLTSSWDINIIRNNLEAPHPTWGAFAEFMLSDPTSETETRPYGEQDFSVAGALDFRNFEETDNITLSSGLTYDWTDNLNSDLRVGLNRVNRNETQFILKGGGNPDAPSPGQRSLLSDERMSWTFDVNTNAQVDLTRDIQSTTTIGAQSFWETRDVAQSGVQDFPSSALRTLRGGATVSNVDEFREEVVNAGIFVQQQLGYRDRLFLTGGARMDGNSAFGEDFGFEFYPKVGLSWVVSEEAFWNIDALSNVRLRGAYGTSGLQPGAFDAQRTWRPVTGIENDQAVAPLNLGNPDLQPERSREIEVGLEFAMLADRLGFEAVYFDQKTTDALLPARVSPSLGFLQAQLTNIGALESWGVELSSTWSIYESFDWGLSLEGSYSYIDQTVTDMGDVPAFRIEGRRRWSQIREGFSPGAVIAPVHDPNNPWSTSVPIEQVTSVSQIQPNFLKASNGADSLVYIGESSPTWTASLGATIDLPGNLTARTLLGAQGGFIMSRESGLIRQNLGYNLFMAELNRALDPNQNVPIEERRRLIGEYGNKHPNMFSDWMEDADYLQVQEVSLSWRVPADLTARWGLGGTTVSLNARNLLIWSPNYDGIVDPNAGEASRSEFLQNIDYMQGPSPRTFGVTVRTSL
ncbi:MAG: SusC/RagA family TonB-linked outer membrane protein [Gemmatimonadota bacterium]